MPGKAIRWWRPDAEHGGDLVSETPKSPAAPVTIRDVAEQAGVSKSLVSLVLRDAPHVSDARRQAVLAAIAELGYRPNAHARGLARTKTKTVGLIVNDLRNPWFVELLEGVSATLHASGYATLLADSRTDQRVGRSSLQTLTQQGVDGIVVIGTTSEADAIARIADDIPTVLAGTLDPELPSVDVVTNDDEAGAHQVTRHLLDLGHTRIAYLQGPGRISRLREQGFLRAMTEAGVASSAVVDAGGMSEESAHAAAARLLSRSAAERVTAIFAFNDASAIGVLSVADTLGLRVPADLSVAGYDNSPLARFQVVSLTSVDTGNFAIGVQAGTFLLERMQHPVQLQRVQRVVTSLAVRGSTGSAPA
ncbi:LacI family DNA-binding transcriptional regulator [Pseudoclavibacter sp. VKM Ac-2888]|nr:LacI family DNA-binding transcriptional regulator [Pseudoclavibacter sp. VKM Ac-2888]PPF78206.1 LacI family transcriptional regulator [Pseudoclavibacter sp. Z016]PPG00963.1 LacI family transcriptional regulator [Pseudoclavibacter sp. RFBI5]